MRPYSIFRPLFGFSGGSQRLLKELGAVKTTYARDTSVTSIDEQGYMRGESNDQVSLFSYESLESRIPEHHLIRKIRAVVNKVLRGMAPEFDAMCAVLVRPLIPLNKLIQALLY